MSIVKALSIGAMLLALGLAGCASMAAETQSNRALITAFAHQYCTRGDFPGAFQRYVAPNYIQHNPNLGDGRDTVIEAFAKLGGVPRGSSCEIKRIIVDGDLAAVHTRVRTNPDDRGAAVVDILRVENGLVAEHWDVVQPVPEHSVSAHPMF